MSDKVACGEELFDPDMSLGEFLQHSVMAVLEAEGSSDVSTFVVYHRGNTIRFKLTAVGFVNPMLVIDKEVEEAHPRVN